MLPERNPMKKRLFERKDAGGGREVRSFVLQVKAAEDGTIEGYGSVFGVLDNYDDVIAKGAFAASLAAHKKAGTMPAMLCGSTTQTSPSAFGWRCQKTPRACA